MMDGGILGWSVGMTVILDKWRRRVGEIR